MNKPKVIIFTTSYHPFMGGAEVAIQEIARRLQERFDFYIVTSRFRRDLPKRETRPEGTIIRIGFGGWLDKYLLIFAPFYYGGLAPTVLGVDIGQGGLAAAIFKFFHPRATFIFNIQYGEGETRVASGRLGVINLAFRFMLGRADFVTTISSYLLELARHYGYKGPAEVIPNGVDFNKFKNQNAKIKTANPNSKVIITTSRLVPKNGVDILIKAIAEVKKKIPDAQLHIIGDGPERKNHEAIIRNYSLGNNVKLFGAVPYEKIPEYLHEADVFVRPSRSEGMGNSFVEALAAGIPIIGTPVGGITDIIEDKKTGLFCNPEDPQDLAKKIILLLKDKNLREYTIAEGKKMIVGRFEWKEIAESYASVFFVRGLKDRLKILIATPLYPPAIGGPALYAKNLGQEFAQAGNQVKVVSFGKYLKYLSGLRHLLYFLNTFFKSISCDLIFSLDAFSVGAPSALASFISRKPLVIRVEGDFLWEKYVERTRKDVTLKEFYKNPPLLSVKEKLIKLLSGWVMRRASRLILSSEWRRRMVIDAYKISFEKTQIIRNAFPFARNVTHSRRGNIVLWAGRMLYLKNLERLIRAFTKANGGSWELHLVGDGPERVRLEKLVENENIQKVRFFASMSREDLLKEIAQSGFFVLPSLSEVGPNVIAESITVRTPFIMTQESGYAEVVKDFGLLVNPLDEADIAEKLRILMDEEKRLHYMNRTQVFPARSWDTAVAEWFKLFSSLRDTRLRSS